MGRKKRKNKKSKKVEKVSFWAALKKETFEGILAIVFLLIRVSIPISTATAM